MKYTTSPIKCFSCKKTNYFTVLLVVQKDKKGEKYYKLTQCPKCQKHDEVELVSPDKVKKPKQGIAK